MTIESVNLKPGVLFVQTPSGGTLMDIQADRFLALTKVSSAVWGGLAAGMSLQDLIGEIMQAKGISGEQAEALLSRQLVGWQKAELINLRDTAVLLPDAKVAPVTLAGELSVNQILREPLVPWLMAKLFAAELQYRRALRKCGLATTLVLLQGESGTPRRGESVVLRTVRNYYALRRAFRQGETAHDCLFRSLALAAVLRRQGVRADLCIGIVDLPFASHAWVEECGVVLNETLSKRNQYTIIGRF